jgi:CheY-like chemotaxis protein
MEDIELSDRNRTIVLVDCNQNSLTDDCINQLANIDVALKVILTSLTAEKTPWELPNWQSVSKPVTSSALFSLLSNELETAEEPSANSELSPLERTSHRHRILVAEDVVTNQQIIMEMVRLLGHEVEIADNGQKALTMYQSNEYSLIFMDCRMPVMDGYEASKKIREIEIERGFEPIPIIALTAGYDNQDREKCYEAGMNGYISKPFSISDIQHSIDSQIKKNAKKIITNSLTEETDVATQNNDKYLVTSSVLDLSAIESIRDVERQTGKQLLPSILEGYTHQMDEKLEEIQQHAVASDFDALYRTAHAIKSMSASIGAEKVKLISSQIERKSKDSNLNGIRDAILALNQAYLEFVEELDTVIAG